MTGRLHLRARLLQELAEEDGDVRAALDRVRTLSLWTDCGAHFRAEVFPEAF